ncbi:DNA-binding response OmpR family regulator [Pseudonocardia eucalypti]|nr:DNA-binding response OmpR family regulator [Pseudonocardia eucalypti]
MMCASTCATLPHVVLPEVAHTTAVARNTVQQATRPNPEEMHVLLVEHNEATAQVIMATLTSVGYSTTRCSTSQIALAELEKPNIVLLNLDLPDETGLCVLAELRLASFVPILVYSAPTDDDSVVEALRIGADTYMAEPLRPGELLARMRAISRRAGTYRLADEIVCVDDIELDFRARRVTVEGKLVRMTPREFEVLSLLVRGSGALVSREKIMHDVWGRTSPAISNNLNTHMAKLRAKLNRPNLLHTVRGVGYRLGITSDG